MLKQPTEEFNIDDFYKKYLKAPKIFKNRGILEPSFIPDELPHREKEIQKIAELTACALEGDRPPSFFCYGMTGTGKTATIRYVSQKIAKHCLANKPWWIYINCNVVSTPYRILAHIYNAVSEGEKIPSTGLPKDVIFKRLLGLLDYKLGNSICFLVLDEIDILIDKNGGNETLYDLTRLNENLDKCRTSLIGISNKLKFTQDLDSRVTSSLEEEKAVVFHPYLAHELSDILEKRAELAFFDGVMKEGVINLCAALAAKQDGDARKALQLLRKAGALAQRNQNTKITENHVYKAQKELEKDHVVEYIKGLPLQAKMVLTAIYLINKFKNNYVITSGDVYDVHSELCSKIPGAKQLTRRRISDYINELTLSGIITAQKKSLGRYGRTKIINLDVEIELLGRVLKTSEKLERVLDYKPSLLQKDRVSFNNNIFKKLL